MKTNFNVDYDFKMNTTKFNHSNRRENDLFMYCGKSSIFASPYLEILIDGGYSNPVCLGTVHRIKFLKKLKMILKNLYSNQY